MLRGARAAHAVSGAGNLDRLERELSVPAAGVRARPLAKLAAGEDLMGLGLEPGAALPTGQFWKQLTEVPHKSQKTLPHKPHSLASLSGYSLARCVGDMRAVGLSDWNENYLWNRSEHHVKMNMQCSGAGVEPQAAGSPRAALLGQSA